MSLFKRRRRGSRERVRPSRTRDQDIPAVHMGRGTVVPPDPIAAPPQTFYPPTQRVNNNPNVDILARKVKYPYSEASLARLAEATIEQQKLWMAVADHWDVSIIEVYRSPERQAELFAQGPEVTKVRVSKHNSMPSEAVDAAPYPIDWNDIDQFIRFTYFVKGMAAAMGMEYKNGADWDGDNDYADHSFLDWVHWETVT